MTRRIVRPNVHDNAATGSSRKMPNQPKPSLPAVDEIQPPPLGHSKHAMRTPPRPRLHFLSNLRIFLTTLVIFHHTAIPYGGLGSWDFHSRCFPSISPTLAIFNAMDQTFFMALFMWMAGYFMHRELSIFAETEQSMRTLTTGRIFGVRFGLQSGFVLGRARRLLLPTAFYTLLFKPATKIMIASHSNSAAKGMSLIQNTLT